MNVAYNNIRFAIFSIAVVRCVIVHRTEDEKFLFFFGMYETMVQSSKKAIVEEFTAQPRGKLIAAVALAWIP
ncbi:hypothetical protein T01_10702 [Trichinella spiralis]|uniref:Uncharacterized protein n=1 Tax=Trichinella spiralis TaxID=6334 RepID=A0A0V1B3C6_TRISP|nr:hypothetical protein T01_10702 [Trichinella spiralis]